MTRTDRPTGLSETDVLRAEAVVWLIRLQSGPPNKKLWAGFEEWLSGDPRRKSIYCDLGRHWRQRAARLKVFLCSCLG